MNRVMLGVLCLVGATFALVNSRRETLGAMALEQMERAFDAMEDVLRPVWAYPLKPKEGLNGPPHF